MTRREDWLVGQLPMGMLDDDFFVRFVSIFQQVATSLLEDADNIANTVDVTVAPPALVRYLGSWLGVTAIDPSLSEEIQRRVVRQAGRSLSWRGTHRGLAGLLAVLTGAPAEITDSGGVIPEPAGAAPTGYPRVLTIRVASSGWLSEADFAALVADEIPANVTWRLLVGDRQIHPVVPAVLGSGEEPD